MTYMCALGCGAHIDPDTSDLTWLDAEWTGRDQPAIAHLTCVWAGQEDQVAS